MSALPFSNEVEAFAENLGSELGRMNDAPMPVYLKLKAIQAQAEKFAQTLRVVEEFVAGDAGDASFLTRLSAIECA